MHIPLILLHILLYKPYKMAYHQSYKNKFNIHLLCNFCFMHQLIFFFFYHQLCNNIYQI